MSKRTKESMTQGAAQGTAPLGGTGTPPHPKRPCSVQFHTPASGPHCSKDQFTREPRAGKAITGGYSSWSAHSTRTFPLVSEPSSPNPILHPRVLCPRHPRSSSNHAFPSQCDGAIIGAPSCALSSVQPVPPAQAGVTCRWASGLLVGTG